MQPLRADQVIRDFGELTERQFDVVVVGGGIFGACIAWDATLRGLDTALLEQEDFGHATSANSFKMVHGGIRYIQHGDIPRIRESSRERRALLRIAPHLVEPLPILIPTYGHGMKGKELLAAGMVLYDLLTLDRNRGIRDPDRKIPAGRLVSRRGVLEKFPDLPRAGLTGGALFHDAQMYNPTRLVLAFLKGAAEQGAALANYARVQELLRDDGRVVGVRAIDRLSDTPFSVNARMVVNATGPWAADLLPGDVRPPPTVFSRDACFVVPRRLTGPEALAVLGEAQDSDALLSRQTRHLFLVPWRDVTLVGVWHVVHEGPADSFLVRREELQAFVDEVNAAYPAAELDVDDVTMANAGLVLFGDAKSDAEHLSFGKRSLVVDHEAEDGLPGLISVIGVRYTTARGVAARAMDAVLSRLGIGGRECRTETTPLPGGRIDAVGPFIAAQATRYDGRLDADTVTRLARNYGSEIDAVLDRDVGFARLGTSGYLAAEVLHAVHEEMACTLADVVFRRTDMGTAAPPAEDVLEAAAGVMGDELKWSAGRRRIEIRAVTERYGLPARPLSPSLSPASRLAESGP